MSDLKQLLLKKCKRGIVSGDELSYIKRLPTGIAGLDCAIGGGLPVGRVIQIWGPESVGKSALALSLIKARQLQNPDAEFLYVDAETTVTKEDIDVHEIQGDKLVIYRRPLGGEDAIDTAMLALNSGAEIAVVDSVPYLRPQRVLEEIMKDSSYRDVSSIALLMERVQSKIILTVEQSQGCLIFINQARPPKDIYKGATHPGGSALNFMLSLSLHVYSAKKDKENPHLLTQNIIVNKNKTYTPLKKFSLLLDNRIAQRGISLIETCLDYGVLTTRGGGHFGYPDETVAAIGDLVLPRSLDKAGRWVEMQPELYNALYNYVLSKAVKQGAVASSDMEEPDAIPSLYAD